MGKGRRNRARRQAAGAAGPPAARLLRTMEDINAAGEEFDTEMPGRITYLTDPVLGGGRMAGDDGTVEPVPVVLFEPARTILLEPLHGGVAQDAKLQTIIAHGFHPVPGPGVWAIKPALGWEVRRVEGGLVLRDAAGDVWASSPMTLDPAWVSAAASHRWVAVFYGPCLGVRTPPQTPPAAYATAARAAEFRTSRQRGLIAAAMVTWAGEAVQETLTWTVFLPGSFGQPLAGVYVPLATFTRHGGPEMFGMAKLRDHGMAVPAEPAQALAAQVSRTDIDLVDPTLDVASGQIGGVHYHEGIRDAWRKAAIRTGHVLVLTGHRLPPSSSPLAWDELGDLWAAVVAVTPA
jgi:hypothetical protein